MCTSNTRMLHFTQQSSLQRRVDPAYKYHSPELSQVVMPYLSVCRAHDTEREAGLQLPQLQQHYRQIVDEQQCVHQRHGVLHYALIILILEQQGVWRQQI